MRILLFLTAIALGGAAVSEEALRRITVVGQGKIEVIPDMATITMGVVSEGKTGAAAIARNSDAVFAVLEALAAAGVNMRDVQTSTLSLSPSWSDGSLGRNSITGFVAMNTVTLRVRALESLGEVLDAVVRQGANNFHGLSFGLQEPAPMQNEARKMAVEDAMSKARLYAQAAGLALGDVLSISEATQGGPRPVMMQMEAMRSNVPVAAGEIAVQASITMVFEIAE